MEEILITQQLLQIIHQIQLAEKMEQVREQIPLLKEELHKREEAIQVQINHLKQEISRLNHL